MSHIPPHLQEDRRLAAVSALGRLQDGPNSRLDRVLGMLSEFFRLPLAAVVVATREKLYVKASWGLDISTTSLEGSFSEAVMKAETTVVIPDASRDPRFAGSPLVTSAPHLRAYMAQPLRAGGIIVGTLAMGGPEPREFSEYEQERFRAVAGWIEEELASEAELAAAAQVQRSLLPRRTPTLPGYEISAASTPARAVGGDFYDWYPGPGELGFTLADVMGKGVGAAIVAATVRAVLRGSASDLGVAETVSRAARVLDEDLSDTGSFVTLFHAKLRQVDGRIRYVDAGHGLSLVIRADGSFLRLAHNDLPLGTGFGHEWRRHTVKLEVGDTLIAFSDGVLDLFAGTVESLEGVVDMVRRSDSVATVVSALTHMAELDPETDDIVVVGIRRIAD
jgi:hypothetical protein